MDAGPEVLDWQFLQCFGERTPGEEIQEGELDLDLRKRHKSSFSLGE